MQDPSIAILVGHFRYPTRASLGLRLLGAYENSKAEYVIDRCPPAPMRGLFNQENTGAA